MTFSNIFVVVCVREPYCKITDQVQSSRTVSEMFFFLTVLKTQFQLYPWHQSPSHSYRFCLESKVAQGPSCSFSVGIGKHCAKRSSHRCSCSWLRFRCRGAIRRLPQIFNSFCCDVRMRVLFDNWLQQIASKVQINNLLMNVFKWENILALFNLTANLYLCGGKNQSFFINSPVTVLSKQMLLFAYYIF